MLEEIDSAIITLCLDDWEHNEESPERAVAELCCGSDPRNRWFDKSVSMIFSNNGLLGINFEHAWGDGVAVMRLCNEVTAFFIGFFFKCQQIAMSVTFRSSKIACKTILTSVSVRRHHSLHHQSKN